MKVNLLTQSVRGEGDVVGVRQRARQIAELLGFDVHAQTRIATAVSEIARNIHMYAGSGKVEFFVEKNSFGIVALDEGPGIPQLADIERGRYVSKTGMGIGILGSRRLMDVFKIETKPGHTRVLMTKELPAGVNPPRGRALAKLIDDLASSTARPQAADEIHTQNQELIRTLEVLREREADLVRMNQELEETNRGVVALYAELDEKATSLKAANESKTKFFSNMTHEFRTPLNSILNISSLLIERVDGDLNPEQEKQVLFVRRAAENLSVLVNDLLDLAKVEAGKLAVRAAPFHVDDLFGALRGMFKPLLTPRPELQLVLEAAPELPQLHTDEGKVAQILRNLVSNAIKYTPRGTIHVRAEVTSNGRVVFTVTDEGIGIAEADRQRIFEEFSQVEHVLQGAQKGTGLGLPLSRRLAQLLGGGLEYANGEKQGSSFVVTLPLVYGGPSVVRWSLPDPAASSSARSVQVLIVDDQEDARYFLASALVPADCRVLAAGSGQEGIYQATEMRPDVILLDYFMGDMHAPEVLDALHASPVTREIPVILHTSKQLSPGELGAVRDRVVTVLSKDFGSAERCLQAVIEACGRAGVPLHISGELASHTRQGVKEVSP